MESLINPTKNLFSILNQSDKLIDLSNIKWLYPIEILPLAALISENNLRYQYPLDTKCKEYLKYFKFPKGLQKYTKNSFYCLPIYNFSASMKNISSLQTKSEIISNLIDVFAKNIGSPKGAINALSLAIDEIISNIEDHSEALRGWIHGQHYPNKKFLDVCILDRGITIKGCYQKNGRKIFEDKDALIKALQGESSKPEKIRGTGLRTFIEIILGAFGGEVIIISGNAIFYSSKKTKPIIKNLSIRWQGTIIAFRIPKMTKNIDYTKYIA